MGPAPILGDDIVVTVKRTGLALTDTQVKNWLTIYGTIEGELIYKYHPRLPTIKNDHCEIVMKLRNHIPCTIPAYGKKVQVTYRGQPIQCSKCYGLGHTRKNCSSETYNWLSYVKTLVDKKSIPEEYFGNWLDYLRAHLAVLENPNLV